MKKEILSLVKRELYLDDTTVSAINDSLRVKKCNKDTVLLYEGDLADKTFYVKSGLIREGYMDESGEDITVQMVGEGMFLYPAEGYFNEQKSRTFIETLENSILFYITVIRLKFKIN